LDTAANLLAQHPRHILLFMKVFLAVMDMRKTIDLFPAEMGNSSA
jgi:hypothetical protein